MIWSLQILQEIEYASNLSVLSESVVIFKLIYFYLSTGTMFYKTAECFLYCFSRHSNFIAWKPMFTGAFHDSTAVLRGNNKTDMLYNVILRHTEVQLSVK